MKITAIAVFAFTVLVSGLFAEGEASTTNRLMIPFVVSETGHILVTVKINAHDINMLVDTAAGASVIHARKVKELGLKVSPGESTVKSLGTISFAMMDLDLVDMTVADTSYRNLDFIALDLRHVEEAGGSRVLYGIIGSTFLQKYKALIDYEHKTISLSRPTAAGN